MKKKLLLWAIPILLLLCGTWSVVIYLNGKKPRKRYFTAEELPNASIFLPAPPDVESPLFADDYSQWMWGKSVRPTQRGQRASWESLYGMGRMETVFGEAMGMTISKEATPAIWWFMYRAGRTGNESTALAKKKYMRQRPFDRMNEQTSGEFDDEESLRQSGSYPSGHTGLGWSTALALAEMAPELQDTILRRGYEYGQSRVIVGAHWQSDVDAAYLAASAAIARMHTSPEYWRDLEAARAEYRRLKNHEKMVVCVGYPDREKVLDAPVDTASHRFYGDITEDMLARMERTTERGRLAIADMACTVQYFMQSFAACVGERLDASQAPAITALMEKVHAELSLVAAEAKSDDFRKRPFVQLSTPTAIPAMESSLRMSSSYPSSHSLLGWGLALVLVEVMPDFQNVLLTRGFEYGRSRVIIGYHYASDVRDARLIAACALPRMHNDVEFVKLLEAAQKEYAHLKMKSLLSRLD